MSSDLLVVNKAGGEVRHQEREGKGEQVANVWRRSTPQLTRLARQLDTSRYSHPLMMEYMDACVHIAVHITLTHS